MGSQFILDQRSLWKVGVHPRLSMRAQGTSVQVKPFSQKGGVIEQMKWSEEGI